jgi:hypothetical protein
MEEKKSPKAKPYRSANISSPLQVAKKGKFLARGLKINLSFQAKENATIQ